MLHDSANKHEDPVFGELEVVSDSANKHEDPVLGELEVVSALC